MRSLKQRAAAADSTIPFLLGVISGAYVRCMFSETSLALLLLPHASNIRFSAVCDFLFVPQISGERLNGFATK